MTVQSNSMELTVKGDCVEVERIGGDSFKVTIINGGEMQVWQTFKLPMGGKLTVKDLSLELKMKQIN